MPTLWTKNPRLVQTIDTTAFGNGGIGSSDPAGLTYIPGPTPGTGHIILVDSEVDENPFFKTNNLFVLSETGQFQSSVDLVTGVTIEPTGAAYVPTLNQLFISDDDRKGIFIVSASDPGTELGFIDMSAISSDTEDPLYDPTTGHLMFLEGGGGKMPARSTNSRPRVRSSGRSNCQMPVVTSRVWPSIRWTTCSMSAAEHPRTSTWYRATERPFWTRSACSSG